MSMINVIVFMCYWAFIAVCYVFAYELTEFREPCKLFWFCLTFGISGKGFACLLVLVCIVRSDMFAESPFDLEYENDIDDVLFDLNLALRQEVMLYATTGVQYCAAAKCVNSQLPFQTIKMRVTSDYDENVPLTFTDLIDLAMGSSSNFERHLSSFARKDIAVLRSKIQITNSLSTESGGWANISSALPSIGEEDSKVGSEISSREILPPMDIESLERSTTLSSNDYYKASIRVTELPEGESLKQRMSDLDGNFSPLHSFSSNRSERPNIVENGTSSHLPFIF